jgi:hypothetical protein
VLTTTTPTPYKADDEESTAEITPRRAFCRTPKKTAGGYGPPPKQGREAPASASAVATIQVAAQGKASSETFHNARTDETTTTTPHKKQKQARKLAVAVDNSPAAAKKFADWAVAPNVRHGVATKSKPKANAAQIPQCLARPGHAAGRGNLVRYSER